MVKFGVFLHVIGYLHPFRHSLERRPDIIKPAHAINGLHVSGYILFGQRQTRFAVGYFQDILCRNGLIAFNADFCQRLIEIRSQSARCFFLRSDILPRNRPAGGREI